MKEILQKQTLTSTKWKKLIRTGQLVFLPLALGWLLYFIWRAHHTVISVIENAHPSYLVAAIAGWCLLHLISPVFVVTTLNGCGARIRYRDALRVHVLNLPARYLPGGIWHSVGRAIDFYGQGVARNQLATFFLLENALAAAITLMLGGACVWYFRATDEWSKIAFLGALAAALVLVLVPTLFRHSALARFSIMSYAKSVSVMLIFWFVAAATFILFTHSFPTAIYSASFFEVGGAYLFSWGIGYISFFAPQGLGVFEAVAGGVLRSVLSFGEIVSIVAGFRIIVLFADVIAWTFGVMAVKLSQKKTLLLDRRG
ncbi:MAG: hypothetical protein Q8O38_14210 [Sulfurimicrobium sp.]|nr:hypothetical protein [Sulfurimicrobium sp.]